MCTVHLSYIFSKTPVALCVAQYIVIVMQTMCVYFQENIGKIYICIKNSDAEWGGTPETIETVTLALTGDMDEDDRVWV